MPAVGSQMLSDVSSGIRRYSLFSSSAATPESVNTTTPSSRNTSSWITPLPHHHGYQREVTSSSESVPGNPPADSLQHRGHGQEFNKMKVDTVGRQNMYLKGVEGVVEGAVSVAGPENGRSSMAAAVNTPFIDDKITMLEKVAGTQGIWFLPGLDRQTAEVYLKPAGLGVFIVRPSSLAGTLALSVNIPSFPSASRDVMEFDQHKTSCQRVEHYLIEHKSGKLSLEGSAVHFPSLPALVEYYSHNRDELPVPLCLPGILDQIQTREQLQLVGKVAKAAKPTEFWTTIGAAVNIDTGQSALRGSSMLLESPLNEDRHEQQQHQTAKLQLPHGSAFERRVRHSRASPDSTSGNISDIENKVPAVAEAKIGPQSRLSSKVSDYEDLWSLTDTKSADFTMSSISQNGSTPDHSRSLEYHDTVSKTSSSKAVVGVALRDLDALGDWIESELHDSQVSPKGTTTSLSTPTTPDITINGTSTTHPDLLNENTRVIRRGKRRFANNAAVSRNRFSAPNLSVNVEDLDSSESTDGSSDVRNTHHGEPVSVYEHDEDCVPEEFPCYTPPPRKCLPSRDQNILESFQSKVGALKRIGSKLLSRKTSMKNVSSSGSLTKDMPAQLQERVLVFRAKKPSYDTCWPVDNDNWSVMNRATPTSDVTSSGTSSSTGSAGARSAGNPQNGRYLTIRSSKSPAGSLPKRSKTFSDFSLDPSHNLERDISIERAVTFVTKSTKADFALSLQIGDFLQRFAATPTEDLTTLCSDLRVFLTAIRTYILLEHGPSLEDFLSRDCPADSELKRPLSLELYVDSAVQRLVVDPLCPKIIWTIQNNLGASGQFIALEKGCHVLDNMELTTEMLPSEIQSAVMEKLPALSAHMKNLAESHNLLSKTKQLLMIFWDIFGVDADPLEYSFADTISAFAFAIAKTKAYNTEVHLDFIWQLQPTDLKYASYFPVLLAASCSTTVLKSLTNDSKLSLSEATARTLVSVIVSIKSHDTVPSIGHNVQVPMDRRLNGNQLTLLLAEICDLSPDTSDMTLELSAGCLGIAQTGDMMVRPSLDRWRSVFPNSRLMLNVRTKSRSSASPSATDVVVPASTTDA